MQKVPLQVIKLGGSLAALPELDAWLERISSVGGGRVVIVPGGGPFADQVRNMQAQKGFDDETAHLMALHAMDQYGLMLCGLQAGLVPATTLEQLSQVIEKGKVAVWLPSVMLSGDPSVAASWDITSDSLAAWLAGELAAVQLLLVKYHPLPRPDTSLDELEQQGIVDRGFRHLVSNSGFKWSITGRGDSVLYKL